MAINEQARANVHLDGQQAQDQLRQLKEQATQMRKELQKMKLAKDPEYANKKREFSQLEAEIQKLKKGTFDLNATLNNLSGASYKDLSRAHQQLRSQLRNISRDTAEGKKEFAEKALALKNVRGEMGNLNKQMMSNQKTQKSMNGSIGQIRLAWVALAGAVMGAYRSVQRYIEARDEQLRRSAELLYALQGEEEVTRRLIRVAGELQRTRGVSDEDVKGQMAFLAIQGRSEKQIENTMKAALELSKVMGMDLSRATQYLDATFEGNLGRLTRLDTRFKNLTREQLANGAAVDLVNEKYQGLAEASFKEGLGPMRAYQLAWGDLQKTMGAFLIGFINRFANEFTDGVHKINRALESMLKTSTEKFDEQLTSVVNLESEIRPLLDRYDELSEKSNLSTQEQEEMNAIIQAVTRSIPGAITQFDAYGQAIAISTERAREFVDTETDRLKVVNREAIKETEKNIVRREKMLEESQARMTDIEQRGYFVVIERQRHSTLEASIIRREATQEEINEQIDKHQKLLSEVRGFQTELKRLNGDYLNDEIARRKAEETAARELEQKKAQYAAMTTQELQNLAQKGDALAIDLLAKRQEKLSDAVKTSKGAYDELTAAISNLEKEYANLAAVGDSAGAKVIQAQIDSLKVQKIIMDNLIQAGGDPLQMIETLADSTHAELEELGGAMERFLERNQALSDDYRERKDRERREDLQKEFDASDARIDRARWEAEQKQKAEEEEKKTEEEKKAAAEAQEEKEKEMILALGQKALSTGFNLFSAHLHSKSSLRIQKLREDMAMELSNENLTAEQRIKIQERYQKQEAKIKKEAHIKQKAADIIQSIINNALAISRAIAAPPGFPLNAPSVAIAAGLAAIQTAAIAAQPSPQFYKGRYPVKGASDGRTYMATMAGDPVTGIYPRPALISERGEELIVDAPTTRNIRLNYPHLLDSIMAARVPQYAGGRYPEPTATQGPVTQPLTQDVVTELVQTQSRINEAIRLLEARLQSPIKADVSLLGSNGIVEKQNEYIQLKKNAYN